MIPPRYRAHIITTCLVITTVGVAYGTYSSARYIRNWTRAPSRQMHEEMEQYLYQKQLEAIKQSGPKIV